MKPERDWCGHGPTTVTRDYPRWRRRPPTEAGYWLRVNAGHRVELLVVRDFRLREFRGLKIFWKAGDRPGWLPLDAPQVLGGWWWLGPLPEPPEEAR